MSDARHKKRRRVDKTSEESDTTYAVQLRQHLAETRAHLNGKADNPLPPSYVPPTGFWSSSEKDAFFRGLRVHSRLRPDLIAAGIGSKNVFDVCAYIDTLDVHLRDRTSVPRAALEGAMEVSDDWVQWEEKSADTLGTLETKWEDQSRLHQHEEEIASKKAPKEKADTKTTSAPLEDEALEKWEREKRRRWDQESILKRLGPEHLKVLEWILDAAETGPIGLDIAQSQEDQLQNPQVDSVDEIATDPPPLGMSEAQDAGLLRTRTEGEPHTASPPSAILRNFPPEEKCTTPAPTHAHDSSQPLPQSHSSPPEESLSPTSRRRFQKRLYMRRKRATRTGKAVIVDAVKLRPGRQVKETNLTEVTRTEPMEHDSYFVDDVQVAADADDASENKSRSSPPCDRRQENDVEDSGGSGKKGKINKGGLTKIYKIKRDCTRNGIDAKTLVDGNLGLFHMSALSRLMMFYKAGYDTTTTKTASSISADTIRLMAHIIVEFVTEVVERTITSREQERRMKSGTKVYGLNPDEITAENVNHVLEMMGMKGLERDRYFAQLLGEDIAESDDDSTADDGSEDRDSSACDTDAEGNDECQGDETDYISGEEGLLLPLHRELHQPLVHLPKSYIHNGSNDDTEFSLMPDETDEDSLDQALQEEIELDRVDGILSRKYEAGLWKQVGHAR